MTLEKQAAKVWKKIRSQLEDRSVLELGSVDEDTISELEAEQIETIAASFRPRQEPGQK